MMKKQNLVLRLFIRVVCGVIDFYTDINGGWIKRQSLECVAAYV